VIAAADDRPPAGRQPYSRVVADRIGCATGAAGAAATRPC